METNSAATGIVMATRLEAAPFIDSGMFECIEEKPLPVYKYGSVYLILSGIGKGSAAIAATCLILKFQTEIMYNIGAAGSTTEDYKLGDILHIDSVIDYDRPKLIGLKPRYLKPDVLEGYKTATLATQDVAVVSVEEREKVGKLASLVDMEGAAFVQACRTFKVKNYLFKIVTDTPAHTVDNMIIENIKNTRDMLFQFFTGEFLN
jgi:nucleoside phosphorylase